MQDQKEADEEEPLPCAVLNAHAVQGQAHDHLNTVSRWSGHVISVQVARALI